VRIHGRIPVRAHLGHREPAESLGNDGARSGAVRATANGWGDSSTRFYVQYQMVAFRYDRSILATTGSDACIHSPGPGGAGIGIVGLVLVGPLVALGSAAGDRVEFREGIDDATVGLGGLRRGAVRGRNDPRAGPFPQLEAAGNRGLR